MSTSREPETLQSPPRPADKPFDQMTVDELAVAVRYHNWRYFALNAPEISDYAFDRLTRRLQALAPEHPALLELEATPSSAGERVFHDTPMLSLDKCYTEDELRRWAWDPRTGQEAFVGDVVETPKVDGVAASLKYDTEGRLSVAVTRGDGVRGEAFTANALHIADIPKQISGGGPVEVRGEVYMRLSVFAGLRDQFSNPRNTTAGAIKQKVAEKTAEYRLSFFAYDVIGPELETEAAKLEWARAHGFETVETQVVPKEAMQACFDMWLARRDGLDFEIDGIVYKVNAISEQRRLGLTAHHPRYAIAYKFQAETGKTTLLDVEWSVARTGAITPVALIEPIELSGAMVGRCSLHNLTRVEELGVTRGATVVASRRGGVIPHIESVVEAGPEPLQIPATCPSCEGPTHVVAREASAGKKGEAKRIIKTLMCSRPEGCPAVIDGALQHFLKAAEIDGFGPKVVAQLRERGLVKEPADLYRLRADDLTPLERMGETLARKLVDNIAGRRVLPLATFLASLGVPSLGPEMAGTLAAQFRTLGRVLELREEDLKGLHGFDEVLAASIVQGLAQRREQIEHLLAFVAVEDHHDVQAPAVGDAAHPLAGKSVVFTGKLAHMDRKSAQQKVRAAGGTTPSGVTRDLDFLVIGDDGSPLLGDGARSSKHKTADKYVAEGAPLRIITETEFLRLAEGAAG